MCVWVCKIIENLKRSTTNYSISHRRSSVTSNFTLYIACVCMWCSVVCVLIFSSICIICMTLQIRLSFLLILLFYIHTYTHTRMYVCIFFIVYDYI